MKIQDIAFFLVLAALIFKRSPQLSVIIGILCLILAIPLFLFWIFFTAQRLIWYAVAFFLLTIIFYLFKANER
jgi:hypothetical protein